LAPRSQQSQMFKIAQKLKIAQNLKIAQIVKQSLMIMILSSILLVFGSHQKLEGCLWDMGGVTHSKRAQLGGTLLVFSRFCPPPSPLFFFIDSSLVVLSGWDSTLGMQWLACHNQQIVFDSFARLEDLIWRHLLGWKT
jgi:hypothetical protein